MTSPQPNPLPPGIHILLGDSAGGTFTSVYSARDRVLIDQDVLSCGPTPRCDNLEQWGKLRLEFWNHVAYDVIEYERSPLDLVAQVHRLKDAERVHVWAATGVSEQLFVAHVLHLMDVVGADPTRLHVLQFEKTRKGHLINGVGELNEENMSNHPDALPLSEAALADYRSAWNALTSPDPSHIANFAGARPTANRWLLNAMKTMLRRYPDKRTGLSYWDFALLSAVSSRGPNAARVIGFTMTGKYDDGDPVGDWYLFGRLHRLGDERLPQPLLKLAGNTKQMRNTEVELTEFGKMVLAGTASNYPTNPIDDWAGGVKLSSAENAVWFNDDGKLVRG
jgi:hypothetical protein